MFKTITLTGLLWLGALSVVAQSDNLEDINFPLNSSIVVDGFQGLDLLSQVMVKHANLDLEVIGHTDSIGSAEYNKRLSVRRAESVKAYLVSKGAAGDKITTSGEGIDRSFDNTTREGRFKNRRVSLYLFETTDGRRTAVSYPRLIELFFGGDAKMQALEDIKESAASGNQEVMAKLSDLQKQLNAMNDALQRRIGNLEKSHTELAQKTQELPDTASMHYQVDKYTGVSVAAGVDDEGEFTGNIRGLYFRPVSDHFALQFQGDAAYYDTHEDGQLDVAGVYQKGGFKIAAAGSYKWASINSAETARIAQGAVIADWRFGSGKFGLFGTFPIADGDVISTINDGVYTTETYVSVPVQFGIDFGVSVTDKVELHGYAASVDSEQSDADTSAGLGLEFLLKDRLSLTLDADMNESYLRPLDDSFRYQLGLKFGSWTEARYNVSDQMTPVNIPRVRYELLTRRVRTGNTAPIADAGASRTNVAAGTVTLDGSGSSDPEGDPLTYKWTQTSGPTVELTGADAAVASFTGVAGESYVFQLQVRDDRGASGTDVVSIAMEAAPEPEPQILVFTASPTTIDLGEFANLTWDTQDATEVSISGVGGVPSSGSLLVAPEVTTEYTLTATNAVGSVSQSVTVTVIVPDSPQPVIDFFTAVPDTINAGEFTTLSWSTKYADSVAIVELGNVNASGSLLLRVDVTTSYTLTATNSEGSVSETVTVTVRAPEPEINFFTAIPGEIVEGGVTTISWSTEYAETVTISGLGDVGVAGSLVVSPTETTSYTLTATNGTGSVDQTITVTVIPLNNPPIADAGIDFQVGPPGDVTLDGTRSFDPDGDPLTYEWIQIGGNPVTLTDADTATPSFNGLPGVYHFRLTVRDGRGGFDLDDVTVSVVDFKQ